jgi:anthrone oxygenase-like protein
MYFAVVLAIFCSGLFAGAAAYVSFVEHPARMACGTLLAATEFGPSYRRATVMQAALAAVAFSAGLVAWRISGFAGWLLGACFIGAVIPFTLIVIFPTNKKLLDASLDGGSEEARRLLVKWGRLHAVRTVLGLATFVIFLLAPSGGDSVRWAREAVLRQDLFEMRSLISQYTLDKQKAPQSLEDLVSTGYMTRLPVDPMTGRADWVAVPEDVTLSPGQRDPGIDDAHSASKKISSRGDAYNKW